MFIENLFKRGDFVYLVTDPEQKRRVVLYLTVFDASDIMYDIICGTEKSSHYDFELTSTPDKNILLGISADTENGN